ncbi:MAG: hypothetical protein M1834_003243 [Cirrosporium novae-zelandiae]|nr:MAG: hypothetical protein M1834_003243 [Cirrosporium novae-zelandiae]
MESSILLKNGTILSHAGNNIDVIPLRNTDLLITGSKIAAIGPNITSPNLISTKTVDCTDKIISPGFIDTHHHLWQTQLKGRHANDTLLDYMYTGNMTSYAYKPEDVFWGQLGGCLEAIDAGTTTVVDHAHVAISREHITAALTATNTSALRCIFCPSTTHLIKTWTRTTFAPATGPPIPEWFTSQLQELMTSQPQGKNGTVQIGAGFDLFFLPREVVVRFFESVRGWGAKLVTAHAGRRGIFGHDHTNPIPILQSYNLLSPTTLLSHVNNPTPNELHSLQTTHTPISSTPGTELTMALGNPIPFHPHLLSQTSLGSDCHSALTPSPLTQMRLALSHARALQTDTLLQQGKYPRRFDVGVVDAFNLATVGGARAVGMEGEIGTLRVGFLADLVIFDARSPALVCAAEEDPVAAVVMHASVRDVVGVVVGGTVRKVGGSLTDCVVDGGGEGGEEAMGGVEGVVPAMGTVLSWNEIARELVLSRERVQERIDGLSMELGRKGVVEMMHVDEGDLV